MMVLLLMVLVVTIMMMVVVVMVMVMVTILLERNLGPISWWDSVLCPRSLPYSNLQLRSWGLNPPMVSEEDMPDFFSYKNSLCVDNHHVSQKMRGMVKVSKW